MRIVIEVFHVELSERQHVLVVDQVEGPNFTEDLIDESVVLCAIQLEHVHGHAKHGESDEEENHEVLDVVDGLTEETNEEGGLLEELAPIEHLDPESQRREGSEDSLPLKDSRLLNLWRLEQVDRDDVDG